MGLLVMEVVFDKIRVDCPEARLRYNRKGQEPLEVVDRTSVEYGKKLFVVMYFPTGYTTEGVEGYGGDQAHQWGKLG